MFDGEEYITITKGSMHIPIGSISPGGYEITEYIFRKDIGVPADKYLNSSLNLTQHAELVIAYTKKPTLEYIFELIDVDTTLPIVDEIKNWCDENLEEYNWTTGKIIKNRLGTPTSGSYPIFEMPEESDAIGFKLRWL